MSSTNPVTTDTIDLEEVPTPKKIKLDMKRHSKRNENIEEDLIPSTTEKKKILFDHNAEMLCSENQPHWEKGTLNIIADLNDPLMVRLTMKTKKESLDELLTVQMNFQSISSTTVKWSREDFSQGEIQMIDCTLRFKTSKICEKFSNILSNIKQQLQMELNKCCKYYVL